MNSNELKAEIVRNGLTIPKLAKKIGIGKKALYQKLAGKTMFNQKEIVKISKELNLSKETMFFIFFADLVS